MALKYNSVFIVKSVYIRELSTKTTGIAQLQVINEGNHLLIVLRGNVNKDIFIDKYSECYRISNASCIVIVSGECTMIHFKESNELDMFLENIKHIKICWKTSAFSERTDEASATQYFQFYGYLSQQQNMLQDYIRTNTYQKAFFKNCDDFKDKIVLDVGSGCGILSFFAVHAGAKLVYAVEASSMSHHSMVLVCANNFQNKIKVIPGKIEEIELPEKVDVIVSEPLGYMLFNERMIETYLHSKKWLKPGGKMYPCRGDLHIAPFMDDALFMEISNKVKFWDQTSFYNIDLSPLKEIASKEYFHQPVVDTFDIGICLGRSMKHSVDFTVAKETDLHRIEIPLEFNIRETGTVHGLAFWFEVAFIGSRETIWLSTSPTEPLTHWYQVRCLLKSPLTAKAGQCVVGTLLLLANQKQSYDISIELSIGDIKSFNILDLKNPYFRYASHTPTVNSTSPSEAYWNHLENQNTVKETLNTLEKSNEEITLELTNDQKSTISEAVGCVSFIDDNIPSAPKMHASSETIRQRSVLCPATSSTGDCLHLQLYRDSKDRYKQGQTKASLSLQHFLGVETGFTLDKESNTIAILCQDVTVVLAFDTRERLIQWQVKIASNLGEDQQFLVQICSAPHKSKLAPGPARLHVQEYRFCISLGVPPRLVGVWEISQLRRYGVVENRFCFEGGSRCGKGEGLYVLITDQAEEITRTLQAASEGRMLSVRRRSSSRNMSVMDSPRKCLTRLSSAGCDSASLCQRIDLGEHSCSHDWPSTETRTTDSVDFGDTVSVNDYPDQSQDVSRWSVEPGMGRCASCISKLGAMSRSSTAANTPATAFSPAWVMDMGRSIGSGSHNSNCSTMSVSSHESGSEYSVPRLPNSERSEKVGQCDCEGPGRPPKPGEIDKNKKPPMPSPALQNQNFANYDVPKTIYPQIQEEKSPADRNVSRPVEEYYDTPRSVKTELAEYDRPICGCQTKVVLDEPWPTCPCRILCWPSAWISLPYCRRGNGIENTSVHLHKVKLSGEGKMPVMNKSGELAIYATIDKSKKMKYRNLETKENKIETVDETDNETGNSENNSNYVNVDPTEKEGKLEENVNYENLDFAQSLEYYENAREVLQKAGINKDIPVFTTDKNGLKFCNKCGHACEENSDYLMMEPSEKAGVKFPGYLPMHPSSRSDIIKSRLSRGLPDRASSIPSLSDRCTRRSDSDMRVPGSAMLGLNHPQSANSSPYLTRRAPLIQRKRSSSADSSRCDDDDVTLCTKESPVTPAQPPRIEEPPVSIIQETTVQVQVRRSCSVPCKPGNRDSSSSADSGVSTGSLKQREDFGEFELPLTTALSCRRLRLAQETPCLHSSLPRRSKSSDPLSQLSFQFHKIKVPAKSSSAEAEIPICHGKREPKEYCSPGGDGAIVVPYTDSRSTSSGTSDMSDYIETLSLSSHSSSDTPDSLRLGRIAATTLRPRSGKEYHKIDRYILESDVKLKSITTVPEKCESPSPGYMSSSPGN